MLFGFTKEKCILCENNEKRDFHISCIVIGRNKKAHIAGRIQTMVVRMQDNNCINTHLRSMTSITNSATKAPIIIKIFGRSAKVIPVDPISTPHFLSQEHKFVNSYLKPSRPCQYDLFCTVKTNENFITILIVHRFAYSCFFTCTSIILASRRSICFRYRHAAASSQQKQWSLIEKTANRGEHKTREQLFKPIILTEWHRACSATMTLQERMDTAMNEWNNAEGRKVRETNAIYSTKKRDRFTRSILK